MREFPASDTPTPLLPLARSSPSIVQITAALGRELMQAPLLLLPFAVAPNPSPSFSPTARLLAGASTLSCCPTLFGPVPKQSSPILPHASTQPIHPREESDLPTAPYLLAAWSRVEPSRVAPQGAGCGTQDRWLTPPLSAPNSWGAVGRVGRVLKALPKGHSARSAGNPWPPQRLLPGVNPAGPSLQPNAFPSLSAGIHPLPAGARTAPELHRESCCRPPPHPPAANQTFNGPVGSADRSRQGLFSKEKTGCLATLRVTVFRPNSPSAQHAEITLGLNSQESHPDSLTHSPSASLGPWH